MTSSKAMAVEGVPLGHLGVGLVVCALLKPASCVCRLHLLGESRRGYGQLRLCTGLHGCSGPLRQLLNGYVVAGT
jgi:hypothetical protein